MFARVCAGAIPRSRSLQLRHQPGPLRKPIALRQTIAHGDNRHRLILSIRQRRPYPDDNHR